MCFLPLIETESLEDGIPREVVAEGRIFAVVRVGDDFHVLDGLCAHAGGSLGKGNLQGCVLTCPWHGWQYDVRTGEHCITPAIVQTRYACEVRDGMLGLTENV